MTVSRSELARQRGNRCRVMRTVCVPSLAVASFLMAFLVSSCCEDCEETTCPDTVPPMAVTDLHAVATTESSVTLRWRAPGDDGDQGTASRYDIRYSNTPDTSAVWWDSVATVIENPPQPQLAGERETFVITGLTSEFVCYIALKTADEAGNWSGLSNTLGVRPIGETLEVEMVLVPAGVFTMGDGTAQCGLDERAVTLTRGFHLGQHEVTNQEYLEMAQWAYNHGYVTATTSSIRDDLDQSTEELLSLADEHCEIQFDGIGVFHLRESPSSHAQESHPGGYDPSDHPVKCVTWYGAARFCDWLSLQHGLPRAYEHSGDWVCNGGDPYGAGGYRLPTDAEWEYAAQYDDERIHPWGDEAPDCGRANFHDAEECVGWTSPVGSYPSAPEALGLSDMAGNLWEWCNDWGVCALGTDAASDPEGPSSGSHRVIRGGSWSGNYTYLRCANRNYYNPDEFDRGLGFRIARTE